MIHPYFKSKPKCLISISYTILSKLLLVSATSIDLLLTCQCFKQLYQFVCVSQFEMRLFVLYCLHYHHSSHLISTKRKEGPKFGTLWNSQFFILHKTVSSPTSWPIISFFLYIHQQSMCKKIMDSSYIIYNDNNNNIIS